jgi:chromosome segregation ATPase
MMNLEKVSMLSQKIEGILGMVRTLKEENARIRRELSQAQAVAQDKSMLLDSANANLADCKAALEARANQANAQQDMLSKQEAELAALTEKSTVLGQQLIEKDGCIESLNDKVRELSERAELLNAQLIEKAELINTLNSQTAEKDSLIANLTEQLSTRGTEIENLNVQLQAQNEEIAEAQERFTQLVETIESELGTDIALDQGEATIEPDESYLEAGSEEDAPAETEEAELQEPQVEEPESQEPEEDIPTIEVHGADETDNDLFASKQEGSQTSFFG